MYKLSKTSEKRLNTCHKDIQLLIREAIKTSFIDFGVACGHRTVEVQQSEFKAGRSQLDGINKLSPHNHNPSLGFDLYAYDKGAKWDPKSLTLLAGHILSTAKRLDIDIEWGGNWKSFVDMPHFNLK